jgi:A/G-specific adenine glycosylase
MELGALVCVPRNPRCNRCPLEQECVARLRGLTDLLPVKSDKKHQRSRYFNYIFLHNSGSTWINKRTGRDIWHSLYEFPLIETSGPVSREELSSLPGWNDLLGISDYKIIGSPTKYKHKLSHQTLHCTFYNIDVEEPLSDYGKHLFKTEIGNLGLYPVPRVIENYIGELKQQGSI